MKRVAIPVLNGKLSEYLCHCDHYEIFNIEGGTIGETHSVVPPLSEISELPQWASQQEITDLVAHRVDNKIISLFTTKKISLFVGIDIDAPSVILEEYLNGKLESSEAIIDQLNINKK